MCFFNESDNDDLSQQTTLRSTNDVAFYILVKKGFSSTFLVVKNMHCFTWIRVISEFAKLQHCIMHVQFSNMRRYVGCSLTLVFKIK